MPTAAAPEFAPGLSAAVEADAQAAALTAALEAAGAGDLDGADARLRKIFEQAPESAVTQALLGLTADLAGRVDQSRRWLARAAESAPAAAWPLSLAGVLWLRRGALADARAAFDAAAARGGGRAVRELRARVLSDLGFVAEAVADLDAVIDENPEPRLYFQRALYHMQRRKHPRALRDLERAIKAEPENADFMHRRAELHIMLGRLADAQADADRAAELAPEREDLALSRLRLLLMRGELKAAARVLKTLPAEHPEARFYAAYADFKSRRFAAAAKAFADLAADDGPLTAKARFYALTARLCDPTFRKKHKLADVAQARPRLLLLGLGLFPPYDAPADELPALLNSDVLFNNLPHPEVRELLHAFQDEIYATTYDAAEDEFLWADRMYAEFDKGRAVTFVTRGHPLMFGRLACECVRRAVKRKAAHGVFASPTSVEVLLARSAVRLGVATGGYQVQNILALEQAQAIATTTPLILNFYYGLHRGEVAAAQKTLERFYAPDHPVLMYGPKYDTDPRVLRLGDLARDYAEVHASLILYVPAAAPYPHAEYPPLKAEPGARLLLANLGVFGPDSAPLDVLHQMSAADIVVVDQHDTRAPAFVKAFSGRVIAADGEKAAAKVLGALADGRVVGWLTRGFPSWVSPQAAGVVRVCAAAGVPVEPRWCPSPHGVLLARRGIGIGDHVQGVQNYTLEGLAASQRIDISQPVMLSLWLETKPAAVVKELRRFYPAEHPVAAYGPNYADTPAAGPLGELGKRFKKLANVHLVVEPPGGLVVPEDMIPGMPARGSRRKRKDA